MQLAVVIPTLNAAHVLPASLAAIRGVAAEIIIVDAGSADATAAVASAAGARLLSCVRNRGAQLAAGVAAARAPWLLLLHADTRLTDGWMPAAAAHIAEGATRAGYFRFALDSADGHARHLEGRVAWRCRVFALPYGDQGLLIHRDLLAAVGGLRPLPLMEDVDLVRRLGRRRLVALDAAAVTSADKWEREGWRRRSLRNLLCLSLYLAGTPPHCLVRLYG